MYKNLVFLMFPITINQYAVWNSKINSAIIAS